MGILGTILSLIGGLISRPKYLWIGLIIIGIVYIASFYGYFAPSSGGYPNNPSPNKIIVILVLILLPGLVCVGEGIFLLKHIKRVKNRLS